MRKLIVAALLFASLFASNLKAQTYLVGASGGDRYDNMSAGVTAGIELPVKRFELDFGDTFSPIENHVALGYGTANVGSGGAIFWATKNFGLSTAVQYSTYAVTAVSKGSIYASGDLVFKKYMFGLPSRISTGYVQQVGNGITNGVETSHLMGVHVGYTTRVGCTGPMCFRISEDYQAGRVLTQGNPVCDGTFGNGSQVGFAPCPRKAAFGFGFSGSVILEFPRHRGHEYDLF